MAEDPGDKNPEERVPPIKRVARSLAIVDSAIGIMIGSLVAGYFADRWLNTSPWFLFLSICLGLASSIYNLLRRLSKNQ
ncbi:MAG: AtpZ/AtpI family protein [Acidobacteria bacterium]|nr:AtpZ/AtpI family protein [Acidobacteriota bacterium]